MRAIELLAPARDLASGMAAVDSGADAVYIGGARFGARHAAGNSTEDIARLVDYARVFGVKVYATLNTVVYEEELSKAETLARELIAAGVDALIVQDAAFLRMGLKGVELHASTQMCNTTPEGVRFLQECGFARVILERGLSLEQIRAIRSATSVELECFVHGAICVGFSGRCYLSRSLGPRSGNRGECSQPCRLPWDLVDGQGRTIFRGKHLLSVQDLDLSQRIPELLDAGVNSFKIEGRLKEQGYIRNVVAYYRQVLDQVLVTRPTCRRSSWGRTTTDFTPDPTRTFSRGGSVWMLDGPRAGVASFDTPKAIGTRIGTVGRISADHFELLADDAAAGAQTCQTTSTDAVRNAIRSEVGAREELNAGDGLCFLSKGVLVGTNVNRVEGRMVWPNRMEGIVPGVTIYRNYDHRFVTSLERSRTRRTIGVQATVTLAADGDLVLRMRDEEGLEAAATASGPFEPAKKPEHMLEVLRTQVARCGDTPFRVEEVKTELPYVPFLPVATLNELRRRAVEALAETRKRQPRQLREPIENRTFPYPLRQLDGTGNVTNSLAESFYRDHEVDAVERGFDLRPSLVGQRVMTSAYCLRREIGECLKEHPRLQGPLFLCRGTARYRLEFDCAVCRMNLIKEK